MHALSQERADDMDRYREEVIVGGFEVHCKFELVNYINNNSIGKPPKQTYRVDRVEYII